MGSVLSRAKLIVGAVFLVNRTLDTLSKRLKTSPGLPVPNPTLPFWTIPRSKISSEGESLPTHADIVIIGSGITGASVAYYLLSRNSALKIVILEARDVCSGATGRNGGHINPPLFSDWDEYKKKYGEDQARALIQFRLAHTPELQDVANREDIVKESQIRETEHLEVFYTDKAFSEAQAELGAWRADMPDEAEDFVAYDRKDTVQKFQLSERTTGSVWGPGGAIHPYRFVTNLYAKLLDRHAENFHIATNTPCTSITEPTSSNPSYYSVTTPKGTITTPHVVHATNGWTSHLLEPMREKIVPVRGTMSAQRPGVSLGSVTLNGARSYVFHPGGLGYDYLTQLPTGEHELMFGGGWASAFDTAWADFGFSDDSDLSTSVASHLAGALPLYFGDKSWGKEKEPVVGEERGEGVEWGQGRTKAQWSGILGISADGLPWVGRLPRKISGRDCPPETSTPSRKETEGHQDKTEPLTAPPGEWISAGYTGEGMVHAWMSGKALAYMLLGADAEIKPWFPEILRISEERWKKANLEDFITKRLSSSS